MPSRGIDALVPDEAESWDYYRAVEPVAPAGFQLGAIAATIADRTIALAPLFSTRYRLDTPLQGPLRRVADWLHARSPNITSLSVIGLGSPMSDNLSMGFAPELTRGARVQIFDGLMHCLRVHAANERAQMIAIKSIGHLAQEMEAPLRNHGFNCVTSVPLAMLELPFTSLDDYLSSLRPKTASYLRRKYRTSKLLRMEYRQDINGIEGDIYSLFKSTLANSGVSYGDFQELHPAYFRHFLNGVPSTARMMLCWHKNELVSFQTCLLNKNKIIAKQIGMKYPAARELNLYFVNWLELIRYAISKGIPQIEMGATTYTTKLLFGAYLERRALYYRFRRDISNTLFRPLAPFFDFESNDPELRKLDATHLKNMRGR